MRYTLKMTKPSKYHLIILYDMNPTLGTYEICIIVTVVSVFYNGI